MIFLSNIGLLILHDLLIYYHYKNGLLVLLIGGV